jgi:glutaconate CoA-transferase subunit B
MTRDSEAGNFTRQEIMAVAAAREINEGEVVFVGTGLPMLAAYLSKRTHAPNSLLIFESGVIDAQPLDLAPGVGDFRLMLRCAKMAGLYYSLSLLQRGVIDVGFLGSAEIDGYGNLNSTVIGDYFRPKVRLPGSGGANDIASLAKRTLIIIMHQKRKFVSNLSYLTSPGYLDGPGAREREHLMGGGPARVITDLAILGFDAVSKRMTLESLHPRVSLEEVLDQTGFDLVLPEHIPTTNPPSPREVRLLHEIDPGGLYL